MVGRVSYKQPGFRFAGLSRLPGGAESGISARTVRFEGGAMADALTVHSEFVANSMSPVPFLTCWSQDQAPSLLSLKPGTA